MVRGSRSHQRGEIHRGKPEGTCGMKVMFNNGSLCLPSRRLSTVSTHVALFCRRLKIEHAFPHLQNLKALSGETASTIQLILLHGKACSSVHIYSSNPCSTSRSRRTRGQSVISLLFRTMYNILRYSSLMCMWFIPQWSQHGTRRVSELKGKKKEYMSEPCHQVNSSDNMWCISMFSP